MTRLDSIKHEFVEYIPQELQAGMLYISKRYATASHLCCCGCGQPVVTPLNPAKWRLTNNDEQVSLSPSIGNWSFLCRSHYWIDGNRIFWAGAMTKTQIARVQKRDSDDVIATPQKPAAKQSMTGRVTATWRTLVEWLRG